MRMGICISRMYHINGKDESNAIYNIETTFKLNPLKTFSEQWISNPYPQK